MSFHVVPSRNNWVIRRAGSVRALRVCTSKGKAIVEAGAMAEANKMTLYIHSRNGRIEDRIVC